MSSFNTGSPNSRLARLEMNAKMFRYDADLDRAADLFDTDPIAWTRLPVIVQDRSGLYRDSRAAYRRAVEAGAIPDDRNAATAEMNASSW